MRRELRNLGTVTKKEIKDLLKDPKVMVALVILPAVIYGALGQVLYFAATQLREQAYNISILLIDEDSDVWSAQLESYIRSLNPSRFEVLKGKLSDEIVQHALNEKFHILIRVPEGFSKNITEGQQSKIYVIGFVQELGMGSVTKTATASAVINGFSDVIVAYYIHNAYPGLDPNSVINPIVIKTDYFIRDRLYPESLSVGLFNSFTLFIIGPLLVLSIVTYIAAASMGVEKEEKTLEVLLSLPLKRSDIILAKTIATGVVSVLACISISIGLLIYLASVFALAAEESGFVSTMPPFYEIFGAGNIVKLGLSLMIVLLLGSVIGLIISSFATNVREAQIMASNAWLPVIMVFIVLMLLDLSAFSRVTQVLLVLIPYSAPIIVIKTALSDLAYLGSLAVAVNALYLALSIYFGVKWFDSEKILTAKPRLRFKF